MTALPSDAEKHSRLAHGETLIDASLISNGNQRAPAQTRTATSGQNGHGVIAGTAISLRNLSH